MLSKRKKLFPKAPHLGVHVIYTLYIFAKTLCFCLVFIYFHSLFEFIYIYIYIFYIYIVTFSILCFERPNVNKEM